MQTIGFGWWNEETAHHSVLLFGCRGCFTRGWHHRHCFAYRSDSAVPDLHRFLFCAQQPGMGSADYEPPVLRPANPQLARTRGDQPQRKACRHRRVFSQHPLRRIYPRPPVGSAAAGHRYDGVKLDMDAARNLGSGPDAKAASAASFQMFQQSVTNSDDTKSDGRAHSRRSITHTRV